jgi:hypothetical protein
MRTRDAAVTFGASAILAGALVLGATWIGGGAERVTRDDVPVVATAPASLDDTEPDAGPGSFVAFAADFERFREWERLPIDGAMLPIGVEPGPAYVYASARAPAGTRRWPVGTVLVKTVENGAPHEWTIHAMVKRGVPYNRGGAIGWEFFELAIDEDSEHMRVVWRGNGPPSGHGYAAMGRDAGTGAVPLVCNDCHGAAWQDDGVLTPALSLAP